MPIEHDVLSAWPSTSIGAAIEAIIFCATFCAPSSSPPRFSRITANSSPPRRAPVGIALRDLAARMHPDPLARGVGNAVLAVELLAHALGGVGERHAEHLAVLGVVPGEHLVGGEGRLARRIAQHLGPVLVEVD